MVQRRQRRLDGGAVRRGQLAQRITNALLVGGIPAGELAAAGVGQGDDGGPPVRGVRTAVNEAGLNSTFAIGSVSHG